MKNRILKALASFGLSVCVLAGSSVVSMAEETPGKTECKEHTWKTTTEYKTENRLTVDIEGLMAMLSCGEVTAKKIADYAEARVIVGRRVLYNVDKIKKYIDAMAV